LAGGLGSPAKTLSQGALQLSTDGRYLLAADRGSNEISVLRIEPDGSLELVGDGPVCANGVNPVSSAIHGELVYVDNAGTPTSSGQTNQPWDFDETQPDQYPLLLQFPSFELYRKQVVKQADLVLCTGAAMRSARRRRPATSPTTRPLPSETPRFRRVRRR
jgi:Lactonase, 7-bladed beta-propeller